MASIIFGKTTVGENYNLMYDTKGIIRYEKCLLYEEA